MGPNPGNYFAQDQSFSPRYHTGDVFPRGPSIFGYNPSQPSGPFEGAMQAILPMLSEFLRQRTGGYGFQFGSDMNVANSEFARTYQQQLMAARTVGAADDEKQVRDLFRGLAVLIGHKPVGRDRETGQVQFDPALEAAIRQMSGDTQGMLPILGAMFPDSIDRVLPRGSMTVASTHFVNAGRYVIDPATGEALSGDPTFGKRVLGPLLDKDPIVTAGLGAGRLGGIYDQLVRHGIVGRDRDLRDRVLERDAAVGLFGEDGGGIGMSRDNAQKVQADRVRDKIKDYSQTIAAINDIFAESGRANTPMGELIRGLQVLTQGGLTHYSPLELGMLTRRMQAASQLSGVSIEGLGQMSSENAMMLRSFGGHRAIAPRMTVRGIAMGDAYADMGYGAPSFEAMSRDEWMLRARRDQAAGIGSPFGNLLGALINQGELAPEGSDLRKVTDALKKGQTDVDLGDGRRFNLLTAGQSDYNALLERSGMSYSALQQQLLAPGANQAALAANPKSDLAIRAAQKSELDWRFTGMFGADIERRGLKTDDVLNALYAESNAPTTKEMIDRAAKRLGLDPVRDAETYGLLRSMVGRAGEDYAPGDPAGGLARFRMVNPETLRAADIREGEFEERAKMLKSLQHIRRGGWLRNAASEIREAGFDPDTGWGKLALGTLGHVRQRDVDEALAGIGKDTAFGRLLSGAFDVDPDAAVGADAVPNLDMNKPFDAFMIKSLELKYGAGPQNNAPKNLNNGQPIGAGGAPQSTTIKIDIGKLVIDKEGAAQLSGEGTAVIGGGK